MKLEISMVPSRVPEATQQFRQVEIASPRVPSRICLVRPDELSADDLRPWRQIRQDHPVFSSPFFDPEFISKVAQVRPDVEVAILSDARGPIGFFPFHRVKQRTAKPVGMSLSDFHGVILAPDATFDPARLLRSCGLTQWRFNHLPASQAEFLPYRWLSARSPSIDLSGGFEAYRKARQSAGSQMISKLNRQIRKLEREIGAVQFIANCGDGPILEMLIREKRKQYRQKKSKDHLQEEWRSRLLHSLFALSDRGLHAPLSALMLDGKPIAMHLGLRSGSILHCWTPVYDETYSKYSPGLILLLKVIEQAASDRIMRFDLGRGEEDWKHRMMTDFSWLEE